MQALYANITTYTPGPEYSAASPSAGIAYVRMDQLSGGFDGATMRYKRPEDALGATFTHLFLVLFCVAVTRGALWWYVKKKLMEDDYNIRMPAILQPPRAEMMILIMAAPGMAAVSFWNAYYAGVSGQTGGSFILILHPIALVFAFVYLLYYHVMSDATDTVMWQDVDQEPETVSRIKIKNLHRFKTWKLRSEWVDGVVDRGVFARYLRDDGRMGRVCAHLLRRRGSLRQHHGGLLGVLVGG